MFRTTLNVIKSKIGDFKLFKAFIHDFFVYRKASINNGSLFKKDKMEGKILLLCHALEKGMSFEDKKENWGMEKSRTLCTLVEKYLYNYSMSDEIILSLNVLNAYRKDAHSCKIKEHTERIDILLQKYSLYLHKEYAGTINVSQPTAFNEDEIVRFFQSRKSIRTFSDEPLSQDEIKKALKIANTTPTACNRQTSRVYSITEPSIINQVLNLQLGAQGWADKAKNLFIITGSISRFGGIYERHQVYIDGGLFAMNFVMGLHLYGIASCFKMFVRDYTLQYKVCQICGIPSNETPIVLVLAGHYPQKSVRVPVSHRFETLEKKFHDGK